EADGLIVLPGGIGTLEEAVETLSWAKLSLHNKPMAFLSENNYWSPFFKLVDHMIEGAFLPDSFRLLMADTNSPEAALDALHERAIVLGYFFGLGFSRLTPLHPIADFNVAAGEHARRHPAAPFRRQLLLQPVQLLVHPKARIGLAGDQEP